MRTPLIAVQSSLAWWGKCSHCLCLSVLLALFALLKKRKALLRLRSCELPLLPTSLPAGVHWLSINQELLIAETTLSHQHAISWVTDSTPTTLNPQFKQSCSLRSLPSHPHLPVCLPHLELLRKPNPSRHGEDKNKSWYNHKLPNVRRASERL